DSARTIEADGPKQSLGRDVGEAPIPEISQQQNSAGTTCGVALAHGGKVDPAVVIKIERGDSPSSNPLPFRNCDSLKSSSPDVLPQAEARLTPMCERQIHEAVLVEVERDDAHRIGREGRVPRLRTPKWSFARIGEYCCGFMQTRDDEVDCTIIIYIGGKSC